MKGLFTKVQAGVEKPVGVGKHPGAVNSRGLLPPLGRKRQQGGGQVRSTWQKLQERATPQELCLQQRDTATPKPRPTKGSTPQTHYLLTSHLQPLLTIV